MKPGNGRCRDIVSISCSFHPCARGAGLPGALASPACRACVSVPYCASPARPPSEAEKAAIGAACRSDFMANCSSVTPGGKEALECLLRNQAKLSPACITAVSAVVPAQQAPAAPPAAQAPATPAPAAAEQAAPKPAPASETAPKSAETEETQLKAVRQSCTLSDFMAHCSWIKPDNPELVLCLQSNAADLSPACQAAVQGSPPPAAQAPAAAPEKKPPSTAPGKKSTAVREPALAAAPAAASAAPAAPPSHGPPFPRCSRPAGAECP